MGSFIAVFIIVVCAFILLAFTYKNGHMSGFVHGKRFILFVMKQISPDAADRFAADMKKQYGYDIFGDLGRRE